MTGEAPGPAALVRLLVGAEAKGQRVDRFVADALAAGALAEAPSRASVQRWIEEGRVKVGERVLGAGERVRVGDAIEVTPGPSPRTTAAPEEGIAFEVLYVDDDLVVVDKPAGLVVHPARGHEGGTLVNGLLARGFFRLIESDESEESAALADPRDPEGHLRPGIVHRLDAGTSGVMVVARTALAREGLKAQFHDHSIERAYEAICVGDAEEKTHATLHARHPTDRLRFTTNVRGVGGKRAVTHVEVLARFGHRATHVRCRLETGRTHQIRVHLAEAGTPILGDALYGKSKPSRDPLLKKLAASLGHQALCARVLGFVHPRTGKAMRFEVALPADFRAALDALVASEAR